MIIKFETETSEEIDELQHYLVEFTYNLGENYKLLDLEITTDYVPDDFLKVKLQFDSPDFNTVDYE
jgi:hypothetical protein